jgi:DinB superfamily
MENVIVTVRNELIRSISGLDAWFDKEDSLMDQKPSSGNWSVRELLEGVMLTNRFLLDFIDKGYGKSVQAHRTEVEELLQSYQLESEVLLDAVNLKSPELIRNHLATRNTPLPVVRREIREQLDRCLIHLELLHKGEGILYKTGMTVEGLGQLDIYQMIYFLALHVKCHLKELQKLMEDNTESVETS